jgi:hypothetical protein
MQKIIFLIIFLVFVACAPVRTGESYFGLSIGQSWSVKFEIQPEEKTLIIRLQYDLVERKDSNSFRARVTDLDSKVTGIGIVDIQDGDKHRFLIGLGNGVVLACLTGVKPENVDGAAFIISASGQARFVGLCSASKI